MSNNPHINQQVDLFPAADPIEAKIARAEQRGQRITPWVRSAMRSWAERGVRVPSVNLPESKWPLYLDGDITFLPMPCDCLECGEPAVIFPPEKGMPQGCCICPTCSFKPKRHLQAVA